MKDFNEISISDGYSNFGITLRDMYAIEAFKQLVSQSEHPDPEALASYAYELADAMMEARKTQEDA